MLTFRDLVAGLRKLELDRAYPVIAHASLSAFGEVNGGATTVVGALLSCTSTLVMPVFTYFTMVTPEDGPPHNGLIYGSGKDTNRMARIFTMDMPADRMMGIIPETLRLHPLAHRSTHPIVSFAGVNAALYLQSQTLAEPLAPIRQLYEDSGYVLLLGVNHATNTSIHYGERLAGRKQFVRWALTTQGVVTCPAFPGCSEGFPALAPQLAPVTRQVEIGAATVQAIPLQNLIETVYQTIQADPLALLCSSTRCERCRAVRQSIEHPQE